MTSSITDRVSRPPLESAFYNAPHDGTFIDKVSHLSQANLSFHKEAAWTQRHAGDGERSIPVWPAIVGKCLDKPVSIAEIVVVVTIAKSAGKSIGKSIGKFSQALLGLIQSVIVFLGRIFAVSLVERYLKKHPEIASSRRIFINELYQALVDPVPNKSRSNSLNIVQPPRGRRQTCRNPVQRPTRRPKSCITNH